MAVTPVEIDLTAEIAALPSETFTDVALVGTAETGSLPADSDTEIGEVNRYTSAAEVSEDYGEGSDVHSASEAVAEMGTDEWFVLVLEETAVTDEDVDDGATIENAPALGSAGVTADTRDVVYVTDDPVEQPGDGEVAINMDSGEVSTADGTTATLSYSHVDWSGLERLEDYGVDRAHLADVRAGRQHIGDYDSLVSWASSAEVGVPLPIENPAQYASYDEAKQVAWDVAGYVPGGYVLGAVAESGADLGAYLLGQMAVNDPWHNPYFDGDGYPFGIDSIPSRHIGKPGEPETFLGGDTEEAGPVNVVISVAGTNVLWQSVTTAGAASDYQFFDVKMTEIFAAQVVENALTSLRLREDRIPFTDDGRTMISSTIRQALEDYTGGVDDPFAEIDIRVPLRDDLSDDDVANRHWTGITIDGTLSGDTHEFGLELTVSI